LPFEANALAIVEFLEHTVEEENIHFVADRPGGNKPHSGECYIDCPKGIKQAERCIQFHKRNIANRYIEVMHSSVEEKMKFRNRLISAHGGPGMHDDYEGRAILLNIGLEVSAETIIKIRGVPFECQPDDVSNKFQKYDVDPTRVFIERHFHGPRRGQGTGSCFIVMDSVERKNDFG